MTDIEHQKTIITPLEEGQGKTSSLSPSPSGRAGVGLPAGLPVGLPAGLPAGLLNHYLKIAFRNMLKYKSQTLISLIGLAVGFTCFALATIWIRYEKSFDTFHKNAKNIYVVYTPKRYLTDHINNDYTRSTNHLWAAYLKKTFPEIVNAIPLYPDYYKNSTATDRKEAPIILMRTDSTFFKTFDVRILIGNQDFLIREKGKVAISQKKAKEWFGNENPIGKSFNLSNYNVIDSIDSEVFTICAVFIDWSGRSNYTFDFIGPINSKDYYYRENTIIELHPKTNIKAFEKKLFEHEEFNDPLKISNLKIYPLTKMRYSAPDWIYEIKIQYVFIFAVSGLLVVLCSLINYLTLFVSRFRIRQKELALRVVCGASGQSLFLMLSVEFVLTLIFAAGIGCVLTKWAYTPFLKISNISLSLPTVYLDSFIYLGVVILITLLVFWLVLFIFRRRSLSTTIRRSNKKVFRRVSVIVQLVISIGFTFCTIIILKQLYFLHHTTELGFSYRNRATLNVAVAAGECEALISQLQQIPEITDVVDAAGMSVLIPNHYSQSWTENVDEWEDQPSDDDELDLIVSHISPEYITYYEIQLVAGEMLTEADPKTVVLLNESAVKAFGWHDPVGKHFSDYTVKGVIKNSYNFAPTIRVKPTFYRFKKTSGTSNMHTVLIKYQEGTWKSCKNKIEQLLENDFKDPEGITVNRIHNSEEWYNQFLKSENTLIRLLAFISMICVLICVFGFISLVSLTCEERRKSIAIRKINGATTGDILATFAKEYSLLLLFGSVIAFSTGYIIMQRWLEQYVKQTSIPVWIYLSIIAVMAFVIVLCVGWQVYKASVENPAEVVKSE